MKLIVDIPDEEFKLYEFLSNGGMGSTAIRRILDGKPYEERKTGRWIKHENTNLGKCMQVSWECSACKTWIGCEYFVRRSYCPNCGAKMEGAEE